MPKASALGLHQRNRQETKEPSRAAKLREGSFETADFSGASPVASALGNRSGATPRGRSKRYNKASAVASSNSASSTAEALRSAANRNAVMANLFTLRGIPLVA
jgi:hypothetical protein